MCACGRIVRLIIIVYGIQNIYVQLLCNSHTQTHTETEYSEYMYTVQVVAQPTTSCFIAFTPLPAT